MSDANRRSPTGFLLLMAAILGSVGGVGGAWFFQSALLPFAHSSTEQIVHDYILAHPEILPEAVDRLRQQESTRQLAGIRREIEQPFPGAIIGNPNGKVVMIEFMDFACGYCRQSVSDVEALVAANPDLKVVLRELPILTPESADAARMALAAAEQGRYAAFHKAMFATGRPDAATIAEAARAAGLDMARARRVMAEPRVDQEIARNLEFARQLGFNGTPSWVVGTQMMTGAVGGQTLARAIAAARG